MSLEKGMTEILMGPCTIKVLDNLSFNKVHGEIWTVVLRERPKAFRSFFF